MENQLQGAKGGNGETSKEAIAEIQAKEDGGWNQGGSPVMVRLGFPMRKRSLGCRPCMPPNVSKSPHRDGMPGTSGQRGASLGKVGLWGAWAAPCASRPPVPTRKPRQVHAP